MGTAIARSQESVHSLRSVEAAFYRAKLPFSQDWVPRSLNPYLVPAQQNDPRDAVPSAVRARLIGWAAGDNSRVGTIWQVFVFDREPAAVSFAATQHARCKAPDCNATVLRANNVVYFGDRIERALRALASLHHE